MTPSRGGAPETASAQVIVRAASGARIRGDAPITSENIREYLPSPDDAAAASAAFADAGFTVGPLVGISFSITAPLVLFERFFSVRLTADAQGAAVPAESEGRRGLELPLDRLPTALAARVAAVTFTPPADLYH